MTKTIEYRCKFCGQQRRFDCDWNEGCDVFHVEKWIPNLCCPTCYQHETTRRGLEEKMARCGAQLFSDRYRFKVGSNPLAEAEAGARERLTGLTKRYAELICRRAGRRPLWEPDFVEQLMEQPTELWKKLRFYRSNINRFSSPTPEMP